MWAVIPSDRGQQREGPFGRRPEGPKEANNGRDPSSPDPAGPQGDAAAVTDAGGIADPAGIAHPRPVVGPGTITTIGDGEMMISRGVRERSSGSAAPVGAADVREQGAPSAGAAGLPFAGYDRLDEKQLKRGLRGHSQIELEAVESYERSHKQREAVLNKLRYLRGSEPFPGYDALGADEILTALERADPQTIRRVRGYERKFRGRSRVLDEVVRMQRARRAAEPSGVVAAYHPASARSGPGSAARVA